MITLQEGYDRLVQAAYNGTFPSNEGGLCKYRQDDTAACPIRCPAGLFIPDEKYNPAMEEMCLSALIKYGIDATQLTGLDCRSLFDLPEGIAFTDLDEIQRIHDIIALESAWDPTRFIAELNKLEVFKHVKMVNTNLLFR